ncbi:ATP-dependent RNA helicase ddx18, partial [Perkinsus olseni]
LEKLVETNYHLHRASRDAYRSYLHAYAAHASKDCFDVHSLDLQKLAKCFGFAVPPKVDLNLKDTKKSDRQVEVGAGGRKMVKSGRFNKGQGDFSASNPYGKKASGDKRQFT